MGELVDPSGSEPEDIVGSKPAACAMKNEPSDHERRVLSREDYPMLYGVIDAWKRLEGAEFVLPDLPEQLDEFVTAHYSDRHDDGTPTT